MKPIAHLPDDVAERLKELKADPHTVGQFYSLLLGLRQVGWPLRAIAEPFGVSRVTAKNWESRAVASMVTIQSHVPALPLDVRGMKVRPKRITPGIPSKDRE